MPSYEKNKTSGLWSCRFRDTDENGVTKNRRLSGKYKTKKEAQYAYEDYITKKAELDEQKKLAKAAKDDPGQRSFDDLLLLYLIYKKTRVRESSFYDIERKISTNITPFFSGKQLKDIDAATVLKWQDTLSSFSYAYKKHLKGLLSSIYSYGERYHDIANVMKKVENPRRLEPKKEMLFWVPDEFERAMEEVKGDVYRVFFSFLFFSGCREGEALALSWNDIDLKRGKVNINKSITRKAHDGDKPYKITPPKNDASYRTISIPKSLCAMLEEYRAAQKATGRFVFGGDRPLSISTCERRLTAAASLADVKRIRIHDLRHSCATLLVHNKVSIVTVSKHLGHSDIKQTLNTYSHALPDDNDELVEVLSAASKTII